MAVDAMNFAHDRGAEVIAITDSMISPLVTNADEVLLARSDIASVVDTLVAPLSLINALLVDIVIERKEDIIHTFSELEQVWKEQNVYALDRGADNSEDDNNGR
jgi:DNA-binding MurR/RpiR family transcriptional regulator